jgi:hypothetical protein
VYQSGAAHVDAFSQAVQLAGYDIAAYELNSALAVALADPEGVRQRFADRLPAFIGLDATDVPMEFIDAEED